MATSQKSGVLQHLRRILQEGAGRPDTQLLEDYICRHDETAFALLVRRHGPMVWGVCCRVLRNPHDAEEAFQATFLVLIRRAASITSRELLANWLYGVAHQTALKARATSARRKVRERQVREMPEPSVMHRDPASDLLPLLDEELSRLPEKYRSVLVLCDLEGNTRKEAARHLDLPEGTVASRLNRARNLLARRLTQRGVTLAGGACAAVLAPQAASASVPHVVMNGTLQAATLVATGKAASGMLSIKGAALAEGVIKAMWFNQLKTVLAVVLILGFMATGATILTGRTAVGQEERKPAARTPVQTTPKPDQEKQGFTAWGKEANGLQAGVGYEPGQKRSYQHGEKVSLVLRVRNVSKEKIRFQCTSAHFMEIPPLVTDRNGKRLSILTLEHSPGKARLHVVDLAPGQQTDLHAWQLELRPASERGSNSYWTLYGTGKFTVQCDSLTIEPDSVLSKLRTGKLDLEVKPEASPAPNKEKEPAPRR